MASRKGVMLGVPDEMVNSQDDSNIGWMTNKFGGLPNWMNEDPTVHPQCSLCGCQLPMVAQIYCPLENSLSHRVLYIFGCVKMSCWNMRESWKVFRCLSFVEDDVYKVKKSAQEVENQDNWCEDADDWGKEVTLEKEDSITELNHLEVLTRNLDLNQTSPNNESPSVNNQPSTGAVVHEKNHSSVQTTTAQIPNTIRFKPYYITVLEEELLVSEARELTRTERRLLDEYTAREGLPDVEEMMDTTAAGGQWGKEIYETSVAKHGDKIFQRFKKDISLCPDQCLRYSWNGEPLLMTSQCPGSIPPCSACGGKRVFELQLMPALVSLLRIEERDKRMTSCDNQAMNEKSTKGGGQDDADLYRNWSSESIEFGTVFVYTCSQGCWSEDEQYREEYVVVYSDPDQHRFKNAK